MAGLFKCRHCNNEPFLLARTRTVHEKTACKGENSENQIKIRNAKAKALKVENEAVTVETEQETVSYQDDFSITNTIELVNTDPLPLTPSTPIVAPMVSSIVLPSVRYAHETAKLSDQCIQIAQGSKSASDLKDAINLHLITSNLDQHQVFMIVEYLNDLMTKQTIEYQTGLSKIDDEFNKWTFTDTQKNLLTTYLTSIYMSDVNAEAERKFGVKYNKYINLMSKCPLVANKSTSANMCSIIDELRSVSFHTNGKVSAPLMHVSKYYVLYFIDVFREHWLLILALCLILPAYVPVLLTLIKQAIGLFV
jgi:hypothetical protein